MGQKKLYMITYAPSHQTKNSLWLFRTLATVLFIFPLYVQAQSPGGVNTNIGLWLKANLGVTATNNQVSQWNDQSGSGNISGQASAAASADIGLTANGLNFNPTISFTGASGKELTGTAANNWGNTPLTMFVIARDKGTTENLSGLFATGAPGAGIVVNTGSTNQYALDGNGCTSAVSAAGTTSYQIIRGIYSNGLNTNGGSIWLNSQQIGTGTACATLGGTGFEIGGRTSGSLPNRIFKGDIAEVIVYRGTLSSGQTQQIESYLGLKYGLSLDQTTTTDYLASDGTTKIWDATASAGYTTEITGIGRDDQSGLNQKQAKSSQNAIVSLGLGTIAQNNEVNANNFTTDKQFFAWSHDNASANFADITTANLPDGMLSRMTRVWRAEENNGDVGNLAIDVELTGLAFPEPGNATYTIMVSDNPNDFSHATVFQMKSWSIAVGDTIHVLFDNVNIADNQFFTIGCSLLVNAGKVTSGQTICTGNAPNQFNSFRDAQGSTSFTYQWQSSPDNSSWTNIAGATATTYQADALTTTTYYRRLATNNRGTGATTSLKITVLPVLTPAVSLTSDAANHTVNSGQNITFTATPANGGSFPSYTWYVNETAISGITDSTLTIANIKQGDVVSVELSSSEACLTNSITKSDPVTVTVLSETITLKVPTAFTPNNDGNNDTFYLIMSNTPHVMDFRVLNVQNQTVYETKDPTTATTTGWNGFFNGKPQPNGRYIWYTRYQSLGGEVITKKGYVMLLK